MLKIKDALLRKIIKSKLSKNELLCLLVLIERSNSLGIVQGIYYKEMIDILECSKAQYYNVINLLNDLEFIDLKKDNIFKSDYTVKIFDNDFSDDFKNFTDLNIKLLNINNLKKLKAGEIRLVLYFIFRIKKQKHNNNNEISRNKNHIFYKKESSFLSIANYLNIELRTVKEYCKTLIYNKIISIGCNIDANNNHYNIITIPRTNLEDSTLNITEKSVLKTVKRMTMHLHYVHFIKTLCRRIKIKYDDLNVNDTAILLPQYKSKAAASGKDIYKLMINALKNTKESELNSKVVHNILRNLIFKNYAESIILFE